MTHDDGLSRIPTSTQSTNFEEREVWKMISLARVVLLWMVTFFETSAEIIITSRWHHFRPLKAVIRSKQQQQKGSSIFLRREELPPGLFLRGGFSPFGYLSNGVQKTMSFIGESKSRCWVVLLLSISNEIASSSLTKLAVDERNPKIMAVALVMYTTSLLGFAASLAKLEVSVAYAVWGALGTAIMSFVGICFFGEKISPLKIISIVAIIGGVVGLESAS